VFSTFYATKFAKYLLEVNRRSVNLDVLLESGIMPVALDAMKPTMGF
jgi:hypothetical protein